MKHKRLLAFPTFVIALLALFATAYADDEGNLGPYRKIDTIAVPSGFNFPGFGVPGGGFDISWVDSNGGRLYIADRGNPNSNPKVSPGIDVIDSKQDKFLYEIPLSTTGNGVVAIRTGGGEGEGEGEEDEVAPANTLVVGGSDSTTIFIDLDHPFDTPLAVSTKGNGRADELAYDPIDHIILIANDRDTPHPFVTFISTTSHQVLGTIVYDGSSADNPLSTGGIEQPVWDGLTKKFYIAIPSTALHANGEVDEIDPLTRKITRIFPTTCGPAGLVLIPNQRLMTSCADVLEIANGTVVTHVTTSPAIGADEIWYNPGDQRVYFGAFAGSPVVSALPPYNAFPSTPPAVAPGALPWVGSFAAPIQFSHSIAADSENNHIFVPVTNVGVLVFTDSAKDNEGQDN